MSNAHRAKAIVGADLTRQHEPRDVGIRALDFGQQLDTVDIRDPEIRDHDVKGLGREELERRVGGFDESRVPRHFAGAERTVERSEHERLVVDEQHARSAHHAPPSAATGRPIVKTVPLPTSVSKSSEPWWRSTIVARAIDRPWPVPCPIGFVVKNGSNTRSLTSTGMPTAGVGDRDLDAIADPTRGRP